MVRILIIEDEDSIRENISETLELEGYDVLSAENGLSGVALAQEYIPDLIICDIMMNELDGYGVLKKLHETPETAAIPFIFVTARADRNSVRQGMQLGADDYITKPFTPVELLEAVTARLNRVSEIARHSEERLEETKQQILRLVTDEIRTPLSTINRVLDIISRQVNHIQPHELQDLVDSMSVGSRRLNRIVEQLVLLSYLNAGALSPQQIQAGNNRKSVWELLITAADHARQFEQQRRDVYVRMDAHDQVGQVVCMPSALKHAFSELISNAIQASQPGQEVVVTQWQDNGYSWVTIRDRGPGIPEEEVHNALMEFGHISGSRSEGVGLGLPLAYRILQAHGGGLDLKSSPGRGTQVDVWLPLAE